LIDLHNETTLKTLRVVHTLYRYPGKDIAFILREAMKESKSAGLVAHTQQTTDADVITSRANLHDYADK
jgi:hypothetical protein